mmetsp:Transcript_2295/g.5009  ORF Transcript_2295/g.5009 Transcript_2295/m.5009 type:complete len:94 (+) Transcript_2295:1777-2058(+)
MTASTSYMLSVAAMVVEIVRVERKCCRLQQLFPLNFLPLCFHSHTPPFLPFVRLARFCMKFDRYTQFHCTSLLAYLLLPRQLLGTRSVLIHNR